MNCKSNCENAWNEFFQKSSKLNHCNRRRLFKKIKRSLKRKALALSQNQEINNQCVLNNRKNFADQKYVVFGCMFDCIVKETVFRLLKHLVLRVCEAEYADTAVKLQPTRHDFHQYFGINAGNASNNDSSLGNDFQDSNISVQHESFDEETKEESDNVSDIEKTVETEKFLQELDEEVKKWHNPFLPEVDELGTNELFQIEIVPHSKSNDVQSVPIIAEQKQLCHFYDKVGSCRFGDSCSRLHEQVTSSNTLLLQGMFSTFAFDIIERAKRTHEGDSNDLWLEHSDADLFDEFVEFYNDVLPELESYGKVIQFKVCCNREKHLLGNVYVQYKYENNAVSAFQHLSTRFYSGKHLNVKFIIIKNWKSAICGLHYNNRDCSRGQHCNFLHVFKEPSRRFYDADIDAVFSRYKRRRSLERDFKRHRHSQKNYYKDRDYTKKSRSHRSSSPNLKHRKHSRDSQRSNKKSHKKHSKKHKHKKKKDK